MWVPKTKRFSPDGLKVQNDEGFDFIIRDMGVKDLSQWDVLLRTKGINPESKLAIVHTHAHIRTCAPNRNYTRGFLAAAALLGIAWESLIRDICVEPPACHHAQQGRGCLPLLRLDELP